MQNPTTRTRRARNTAAAAAALTLTTITGGATGHAATPPGPGGGGSVAIGTALAIGTQCPGINVYLNNTNPTPTCAVMSPPLTVNNQVPFIVERKPAYGWWPATCILAGYRWDGFYDPNTTQQAGGISIGARVVADNGNCTGPTIPMHISVGATPAFANYYGVPASNYPQCRPGGANSNGAINLATVVSTCAPHTYQGIFGDWERGHYTLTINVTTSHGTWNIGGSHFIM